MRQLVVTLVDGAALGGAYALVSLGLIIIYRGTDTLNFAHGQFMLLAAYLVARWQTQIQVPFGVVALASLLVVATCGWVLFRVVLKRIIGQPPFMGVVATLGVAAIADGVMGLLFGFQQYHVTIQWMPTGTVTLLDARLSTAALAVAAVSLLAAGSVALAVRRTRAGASLRAAGQDVLLASMSGINVHRVYAASWAIGCALAGLAGLIYAATNLVSTDMVALGLLAFPAILLGGLDSIEGSIVGGLLVGLVQAFTAGYIGGEWISVTTYSVLLAIILFRPSGLFGTKVVVRV
jgi:branched-chain amino acid transport system permease protein